MSAWSFCSSSDDEGLRHITAVIKWPQCLGKLFGGFFSWVS
jgi:hypothetical protein